MFVEHQVAEFEWTCTSCQLSNRQ